MRAIIVSAILCLGILTTACEDTMSSGDRYPSLEMGNSTLVFKIDQVIQNNKDVKPYFKFFDGVELTLSYKDNEPYMLTFTEAGAPFRVSPVTYGDKFEAEWIIDTSKNPYEIKLKETGEMFCTMSRERNITFKFSLGAPSNSYEYVLVPEGGDTEESGENE